MDEARQILNLVTQAAAKIPGATKPVEVELRDTGVSFGDLDPTSNYGFMVRDAMGDPVSIVVYADSMQLAFLAAYDGKLNEIGAGSNLEREKVRRLTVSDVVSFATGVLNLLEEGTKIAKVRDSLQVYDYNRSYPK